MGYYMTIAEHELRYKKDISVKINEYLENNEFYLPWNYGDGHMDLDEGHFKWSNEFIKDLLFLKNLGVRGHVICYGEEGEYLKYEINDEGVKEYCGSVAFPKKPGKVIKSEDDIKKLDF
jgi:hypothetical protein